MTEGNKFPVFNILMFDLVYYQEFLRILLQEKYNNKNVWFHWWKQTVLLQKFCKHWNSEIGNQQSWIFVFV